MMKKSKIEVLELIRFFAMTEVFIIHYFNDAVNSKDGISFLMVSGKLGVAFFFMISAYLLVLTTKRGFKDFLIKKGKALLPKYEILLLAVFIASCLKPSLFRTFDVSIINLVKSVFLIPFRTNGVPFACPLLPVAWTLIVQVFVFLIYWVIAKVLNDNNKAAILFSLVLLAMVFGGEFLGNNNLFAFTYCRFYMLYFVAGFLIAVIDSYVDRDNICFKLRIIHVVIGMVAFLLLSCVYKETLLCWSVNLLIFGILVIFGKKIKVPKCIMFMGKISYSFYLIHYMIAKVFTRIIETDNKGFEILFLIIAYALTVVISYLYDVSINCLIYKKR